MKYRGKFVEDYFLNNNKDLVRSKLSMSKFRSRFHLSKRDIDYVNEKGIETIKIHARKFVSERLADAFPKNDGKQTPMRGHPIFIAQHANACCCRGCLYKWHHIQPNRPLSNEEQEYIVDFLIDWVKLECEKTR